MKNVLLVVDLEKQYITDDDYMGLIADEYWDEVRQEMKDKFELVIERVKKYKDMGYEIHFTGETEPYGELKELTDKIVPYWAENLRYIRSLYNSSDKVVLTGLFRERCVHAVNQLVIGSTVDEESTISHYVIGDTAGMFYDYDFSNVA